MSRENQITPVEAAGANVEASKLTRVREQVKANPDVSLVGEIIKHNNGLGWAQTIDMIVAPRRPIYNAIELNRFMEGLIKGIENSARDQANDMEDGGIHLGRLYYDEPLGKRRTETITWVTPIEEAALRQAGIASGESHKVKEEDIKRRTWLRVYPNIASAQAVYEYENGVANETIEPDMEFSCLGHRITGEQMRKIKEGQSSSPFAKIKALLTGR